MSRQSVRATCVPASAFVLVRWTRDGRLRRGTRLVRATPARLTRDVPPLRRRRSRAASAVAVARSVLDC